MSLLFNASIGCIARVILYRPSSTALYHLLLIGSISAPFSPSAKNSIMTGSCLKPSSSVP